MLYLFNKLPFREQIILKNLCREYYYYFQDKITKIECNAYDFCDIFYIYKSAKILTLYVNSPSDFALEKLLSLPNLIKLYFIAVFPLRYKETVLEEFLMDSRITKLHTNLGNMRIPVCYLEKVTCHTLKSSKIKLSRLKINDIRANCAAPHVDKIIIHSLHYVDEQYYDLPHHNILELRNCSVRLIHEEIQNNTLILKNTRVY